MVYKVNERGIKTAENKTEHSGQKLGMCESLKTTIGISERMDSIK